MRNDTRTLHKVQGVRVNDALGADDPMLVFDLAKKPAHALIIAMCLTNINKIHTIIYMGA